MKLVIVCGPTSAGKDTVIDEIVKEGDKLYPGRVAKAIYYKTRQKREDEPEDGHFISPAAFEEMLREGKLFTNGDVDNYKVGYANTEFEKADAVIVNIAAEFKEKLTGYLAEKGGKSMSIFLSADRDTRKMRFMRRGMWLIEEPAEYRMANDSSSLSPEAYGHFDLQVENKEGQLSETIAEIMPKVKEFIGKE